MCRDAGAAISFFFKKNGFSLCRNGGGHEEGGQTGPGTDGGGTQSAFCRLQERDRCQTRLLAHHLLHRTEGGEQGHRRQTGDDTSVQGTGREGTEGHLLRHPLRFGQTPDTGRLHRRVQGVLLQNEGTTHPLDFRKFCY